MKTRFGIIGCGGIAARFAEALKQSESAQLYAAASRDPQRAEEFAQKHGAQKSYGSYQALLEDPEVDCVYIATVNSTHAPIAEMCIAAGKPLICEKPFFMSIEEGTRVIDIARKAGVLIMEGMWSRCIPAYHKVKQWIAEGRIGDVRLIRSAFCFPMPYIEETKNHRLFDPATGGGACLDVGVYPYEYATGIMDAPPDECKILKVMGPTGVDLSVGLFLKYNSGVIADCLASIAGIMTEEAVIGGSDGYILQKRFYGSRRCELYDTGGTLLDSFDDPVEDGFVHEINHFCEMLREGRLESCNIPLSDTLDFTGIYERLMKED
ncbi:MAG: Gfo/Idh/MocA family oxidoreductase [Parasporobacterium sp.]|nr:Gfo/Idh/MocA family oxidoreductase [Parasporobacterium sp.]